jgi:ADP-heptose:LPS heptosyltransferase
MLMGKGPFDKATPAPRRVVILRALKVGDLLCAVPVFRALRAAWPQAEIVLVGLPWSCSFVERYADYLDGFREFPGYPGLPEREPLLDRIPPFLSELQAERFDLAIQLHGSGSFVNPLTVLMGAQRTAGFYVPGDYCPDPQLFCPWPTSGREVTRLLRLVEFLGLPSQGEHLEFPLREEDHRNLERLDGAAGLRPGEYVCLHPGASVAERRWPPEWFAAVGDALARHGLKLVLTGGTREREITAAVARHLRSPALDLAGATDLGTLAALLSRTRLLVCNDTSVSHLADALGTPSVVLSTGDNPSRWGPRDRQLHRVLSGSQAMRLDYVTALAEAMLDEAPAHAAESVLFAASK